MKTNELLKKYPKTTELVKEWHLNKLKMSLASQEIDDDFKKQIKIDVITDKVITEIIDSNPHAYFEMFDKKQIIINTEGNELGFRAEIYKHTTPSGWFNKRIEAERLGLEKAFEILEKKLNEKDNN